MRSLCVLVFPLALLQAQQADDAAARTFRPLWNGRDLAGWHGQRQFDPRKLAAMPADARAKLRAEDDATVAPHWRVESGELVNDGKGEFLTTDQAFGDAEYVLEYKTVALADSGIYLRGCPQVQIWDCTEAGGKWNLGADKGSGALWNNEKHARFPPVVADQPFGEWNKLEIRQVGSLVWVKLNDKVTVDGVVMENFFDRTRPVPARGPLQLQTHGGEIRFRNLSVREIPANEANELLRKLDDGGFASIFSGDSFEGWQGDLDSYEVVDGAIRCKAGKAGNLFTKASYGDFAVRLQFRLPPGGNNGLAVRYPGTGDPAYAGFEVQVLDDSAEKHATLKPWQYHGSVYGVVASERGYQRLVGEWNFEEVVVRGSHVTVTLNGVVIVDADIEGLPSQLGDKHTGKDRKDGFFGFCGHGDAVEFRDVRIKSLDANVGGSQKR
ncbi:MAG TPA: DUF1080 domain-containing protein [Planctomycetota bacterium]|nr:DUF1080 domain-containing protein [Planctomycetota bacterium]